MKKVFCMLLIVIFMAVPLSGTAGSGEDLTVTTTSLPEAFVGESYSAKLKTNKPDGTVIFSEWFNPGQTVYLSGVGLKLKDNGEVTGVPTKAGKFTFYVYAETSDGSEETYGTFTIKISERQRLPRPDCVFIADYTSYYVPGEPFDILLLKDLGIGTTAGNLSPLPSGVSFVNDTVRNEVRLRGVITREDIENNEFVDPLGWLGIAVELETDGTKVFINYYFIPKPGGGADTYPAGTPIVK
ncbi:MAG: hypothetical protein K6F68_05085 [Clostridiales bacterium]|nr:hypothetical protein [Clostridiales bacterium]